MTETTTIDIGEVYNALASIVGLTPEDLNKIERFDLSVSQEITLTIQRAAGTEVLRLLPPGEPSKEAHAKLYLDFVRAFNLPRDRGLVSFRVEVAADKIPLMWIEAEVFRPETYNAGAVDFVTEIISTAGEAA